MISRHGKITRKLREHIPRKARWVRVVQISIARLTLDRLSDIRKAASSLVHVALDRK